VMDETSYHKLQVLPRLPNSVLCPFCRNSNIYGFEMLSMSIDLLDLAVESKRKSAAELLRPKSLPGDQIRNGENALNEIQAESTYLLANHSGSNSSNGGDNFGGGNSDCFRTGRWTDEEMEFVDNLIDAYDRGVLPVPVGVRLNDFLCSLLLCKASRLTKKMKNAKLSIRAYELNPRETVQPLDVKALSLLQEKFLNSIVEEHARHELRFNMEKAWRTNLSNLCVQIGSTLCNATAWFSSLEQMDNRAALAYENIRKARRHQMGLALKTDVGASNGVFFSDIPVQRNSKNLKIKKEKGKIEDNSSVGDDSRDGSNRSGATNNHISNMLDIGETYDNNKDTMDDFAGIFNDLLDDIPSHIMPKATHDCGSFLEEVLSYVEETNLPFAHIDVWVPSYVPQSKGSTVDNLRLYHAGHCTRSDLNAFSYSQLYEYGNYSTKFSFAPGVGLPGRVFQSGQPSWERKIDEANPKIFERAGGAKVYGIKTGVGIPVNVNSSVRRIIVVLYSQSDIEENNELLHQLTRDLQAFCPKPKWKLVVEMGSSTIDEKANENTSNVNHYHYGTSPSFGPDSDPNIPMEAQTLKHHELGHSMPDMVHYNHSGVHQPNAPVSNPAAIVAPLVSNDVEQQGGDVIHYHHGSGPQHRRDGSTLANIQQISTESRLRSSSLTSIHSESITSDNNREDEIRIAALLGDHMPGAEVPTTGEPSGSASNAGGVLLTHFMSLRLLLLRLPERRTEEENVLLDIIKRSYRGFSRDGNRTNKEIGNLLARDWQYLQLSLQPVSKSIGAKSLIQTAPRLHQSIPQQSQYQSYEFNAPSNVSTLSASGAPISMPPLQLGEYNNNNSSNIDHLTSDMSYFESKGMIKKQRIE
jgi:hypothetical protein